MRPKHIIVLLLIALLFGCPSDVLIKSAPANGFVMEYSGLGIANVKIHSDRSGAYFLEQNLSDFHSNTLSDSLGHYQLERVVHEHYQSSNSGCVSSEPEFEYIFEFEMAFTHPDYDTLIIAFVPNVPDTSIEMSPYLSQVDTIIYVNDLGLKKEDDSYTMPTIYLRSSK